MVPSILLKKIVYVQPDIMIPELPLVNHVHTNVKPVLKLVVIFVKKTES
jgi:hypothetical protein